MYMLSLWWHVNKLSLIITLCVITDSTNEFMDEKEQSTLFMLI